MNAQAKIRLKFRSRQPLESVFNALEPETRTSMTRRSKVRIKREENDLILFFEAKDTPALRAAINSYLHWILLTRDVIESLETATCENA